MTGNGEHQEGLGGYLSDAHAIEEQALAQLRSAPGIAGDERLASALRQHLGETEGHERAIRALLAQRGEGPSWVKDLVMRLGGKGFVLFARIQPDTPGKLLAHSYSYEALEEASYALLGEVAVRAGDTEVGETASQIRAEEIAMKERLAGCYDSAVAASLAAVGRDDLDTQLVKYLADAHAIEQQAIGLLERAAEKDGGVLSDAYREHLEETRGHAAQIEARLHALGADPSSAKDAAMRAGALNWALFFEAHPDTPGKRAAFAYAFEHLEIAGYEQLRRVAERANDPATAALAETILEQERHAAEALRGLFHEASDLALAARSS